MLVGDCKIAIQPLRRAIHLCQGTRPNVLTPIHSFFLRVCLKAKCYSAADSILSDDVLEIDPKATGYVCVYVYECMNVCMYVCIYVCVQPESTAIS